MDIVTLIERFVTGLLQAEEKFYDYPEQFCDLEQTAAELSSRAAADFLAMVLTKADQLICDSGARKAKYNIQRHDSRTLVTTVGDVTFTHTMFMDRTDGSRRYLLDDMLKLPAREKFSSCAEAKVLSEAEAHSYQHAAESLRIGDQRITKTAVMEKVHAIEKELPDGPPVPEEEKKWCEYLYIEADEDHIHSQKNDTEGKGMIGKLVYLFEGKEETCRGRKVLVSPYYMGGLYQGRRANAQLWKEVQKYIEGHYNTSVLKRVYISGDGGAWIRAGADYIDRSVLVADRFHLMKYIYKASNRMGEEAEATKGKFYRCIHKDNLAGVEELLSRIVEKDEGNRNTVEECRSYFVNNWDAIQRAYHDPHVLGCSAEGHVSSVYSERMSSRPMGWSETGSDRMCRLRCFVRNQGREKIIDIVRARREKAWSEQELGQAAGAEGMIEPERVRAHYTQEQKEIYKYEEAMQARIGGGTVRKVLAIRNRLNDI